MGVGRSRHLDFGTVVKVVGGNRFLWKEDEKGPTDVEQTPIRSPIPNFSFFGGGKGW